MTHRQRIQAAIAGGRVDRPPIALWRHFPGDDATAAGLAAAVAAWQARHDFDLVKVTPASSYPAEAWGAQLEPGDNDEGTRVHRRRVVSGATDWAALPALDAESGVFGRELEALELVRAAVGPDVHVLQTIFSPLTIARQLAGPDVLDHVRRHGDEMVRGLEAVADTTARFARACLDHGADGIFFATQLARSDLLSEAEYMTFGTRFDQPVLEAVRDRAEPIVLHLCGEHVMFGLADAYDVDVVNWHDRTTAPGLAEGLSGLARGAVLGGLDRTGELASGSPEDVAAAVSSAVAATGGRRHVVGAGCVTLVTTPESHVAAARAAVETS